MANRYGRDDSARDGGLSPNYPNRPNRGGYGGDSRDHEQDIDYRWEGARESFDADADDWDDDPTNRGYDEAAHSGDSRYGFIEGRGGVFGTSGGGTYNGGFQVIERPGLYDRTGAPGPFEPDRGDDHRRSTGRTAENFDEVMFYDRGPHVGKGPKTYKRTDERIREEVSERLTRHGGIDASDVDVIVENGEVTLQGEVSSRTEKRLAEAIAETVFGVHDVHNRLKARGGMLSRMLGR